MSKQLYEEALADVKQLKQVAEDNAKREIIEAVTPRIRELIEKQLLSESNYDSLSEDADDDDNDLDEKKHVLHDAGNDEELDESLTLDEESAVALSELPELRNENVELEIYRVYDEVAHGLEQNNLESSQTNEISLKVESLYNKLQGLGLEGTKKGFLEEKLEDCYAVLNGLMEKNMMKKRKLDEGKLTFTLESEGITDDLAEKMGDVSVEIVQEEEEGEASEEEAPEASAGAEPVAGAEGEGEEAPEAEAGGEEEGDLFESLSGDPIVEINESELRQAILEMHGGHPSAMDGEELDEYALAEDDKADASDNTSNDDDEELVELSGDDLDEKKCPECGTVAEAHHNWCCECGTRFGVQGMEERRTQVDSSSAEAHARQHGVEQSQRRRTMPGHPESMAESKGSVAKPKMNSMGAAKIKNPLGTASKEMKDKDWYMKDGKKVPVGKTVEKAKVKAGAKGTVPGKVSVPKPPAIKHNVKESLTNSDVDSDVESDSLRAQLAEANLFNAKLLYTNKLLQNDSLSARQKAQVIEQLDEATSLREVKLVYESLQKTLATKAPIRESADRVVGTSSRPTSSGGSSSVLSESVEASRWARLAGIK